MDRVLNLLKLLKLLTNLQGAPCAPCINRLQLLFGAHGAPYNGSLN